MVLFPGLENETVDSGRLFGAKVETALLSHRECFPFWLIYIMHREIVQKSGIQSGAPLQCAEEHKYFLKFSPVWIKACAR